MKRDLHSDGPFQQVLMYCDSSANQGSSVMYDNKTILLAVGLQCGPNKMWDKENSGCVAMNENVRNQLLNNHNQQNGENESGEIFSIKNWIQQNEYVKLNDLSYFDTVSNNKNI